MEDRKPTGKTTEAIRSAPKGALYVWVTSDFGYPVHIAKLNGREDIKFCSPMLVERRMRTCGDLVVIDHAAQVPLRLRDLIYWRNQTLLRSATTKEKE